MALVATLSEFKSWLNRTDSTDDTELTMVLTAASQWVESVIGGPLAPTVFTEYRTVDGRTIAPRRGPLNSVTSITPDQGTALDSSTYVVDTDAGLIRLRVWLCGLYTLVYTAGLTAVNDRQKTAGLEVARHLWLVQNGSSGRGWPSDDLIPTPMGFAVPRRAAELLAPDRPVMVA